MKTENRRDFKSNIRIAAACATTIMLLVFVTFSSFYIAREAEHNCTDEDCPICSCIEMCASTLNHIEDGLVATAATMLPVLFFILTVTLCSDHFKRITPVERKVRLND